MSHRSLALALALGAGLLLASGCGSDDDRDDAESVESEDTSGTTAAGADDTEPADGEADDTADDDTEAAGDVDPCDALAGVDAEALVGEPVAAPQSETDIAGDSCLVDAASGSNTGLRLIISDNSAAENFENQRQNFGVDSEVEGLGDGAFHTGAYLFVLDGDRLVYMQVVQDSANGDGVEDADLEAAMRTVLDNLAG